MPDEATTPIAPATAPAGGLTASPPPAVVTPAAKPDAKAAEAQKPAPSSAEWNKLNAKERQQRTTDETLKKQREELGTQQAALAAKQSEIDAIKSGDPAKIIELLGGLEGYNKLTSHLLQQRAAAKKTGAPAPTVQNIDAVVAKAIADHEAKKEREATEAKTKAEAEAKKAADARFAQLSTECAELIATDAERFTQLQLETGKQPGILETMLREVEGLIMRPEGWTVGTKTLKGTATLDQALDLLEDALVERAATFASAKVRARLAATSSQAEKPAEQGGTRKSESGGPTTLTTRLSQESTLTSRPAEAAAPTGESPLARKQREERESLERAIADTSTILNRKK